MIERYSRPEMAAVWSEQSKYDKWLLIELAVSEAWADEGVVPAEDMEKLRSGILRHRTAEGDPRSPDPPRYDRVPDLDHREARTGGTLAASRTHDERRVGHGNGPAARGGGRAPRPRGRRPDRRARTEGPGAQGHDDDGPNPRGPRRAHHLRPQDGPVVGRDAAQSTGGSLRPGR